MVKRQEDVTGGAGDAVQSGKVPTGSRAWTEGTPAKIQSAPSFPLAWAGTSDAHTFPLSKRISPLFSALHPPHLRRPAGPHSQLAPREVLQPQVVRGARKQAAVQLAASEAAVRHVSSHGEWGVTATEQEGKGDAGGQGDAGNGGIKSEEGG